MLKKKKRLKKKNKVKEQKQDELSQQKEESKDSEKTEDKENVLQKVSEEVLDNKENTDDQASKNKEDAPESEKKQEPVEDDNWFLSKLKDRYDKEFKSIDEFKVLLNSESKKNLMYLRRYKSLLITKKKQEGPSKILQSCKKIGVQFLIQK